MKARLKIDYHGLKKDEMLNQCTHGMAGKVFGNPKGNNWYTTDFVKGHPELFEIEMCKHNMTRNPREDGNNSCRLCGLPYKL